MDAGNYTDDIVNLNNIALLCEEITGQAEREAENFTNFFRICENIVQDALIVGPEDAAAAPGDDEVLDRVQEGGNHQQRFTITSDIRHHVKRFHMVGRRVAFRITEPAEDNENPVAWFRGGMADVIQHVLRTVPASDMVGMIFHTPRFEAGPAWMSFRRADQLDIDVVWDIISRILQSNAEIFSDGQLVIELTQVSLPVGRGRHLNGNGLTYAELCRKKYGIVEIDNRDNLCLPRALVVAESWMKKEQIFKDVVKDKNGVQGVRARDLLLKSGVRIPDEGAGIAEIIEFQRHFRDTYNIVVYAYGGRGEVIFEGARDQDLPRLNLLHHQHHFSVIKSLTAVFSSKYFCEPCHKPYNALTNHRCENICAFCHRNPACPPNALYVHCDRCNRRFRGQQCFDRHTNSVCNQVRMCKKCHKVYKLASNRQHVCGEIFCKLCDGYKLPEHKCYIRKDTKPVKDKKHLFLYYDLETRQEKIMGTDKVHEVNLCVVQQTCDECNEVEDMRVLCSSCGTRQHVFKDSNAIKNFVEYALLPRSSFSTVTCIAHNAKSFDCQFILKYLTESMNMKPKLIMNGNKILLLEINYKVRFIDSLNYLPMSLAALTKAMDLPPAVKKGYFPHLFNTRNNAFYVGPLPAVNFYGCDTMQVDAREKFIQWHAQQASANKIFDMQREIVEYCVADVEILRRACTKFRRTFIDDCNVCPFTEAVTIASACNRVFRRQFLKKDTIGIIPLGGYRMKDKQSKIAIQWLINEEIVRGIRIEHAGHGKESVLAGCLKVDGFHAPSNSVFEFLGCFWHGCELCYRTNRDASLYSTTTESLNARFQRTTEKLRKIEALGYNLEVIWECAFRKKLESDRNLKKMLQDHSLLLNLPLQPRDAFFGGRTGNTVLYKKSKGLEKIKYVDVCSLYPYVCKYGKYPVGHPEIYVGAECAAVIGPGNNIDRVEGLIKCTILPPTNLYHPVLPRKVHNKLMFALCRTCCDELTQIECTHADEERQFVGTWVVDEVRRAVQFGYKVINILEVWQYQVTVYDRAGRTGGLFVDYINRFLKMKQEASGYPPECVDQEAKDRYITEYADVEGIDLNPGDIEKNAGKRSLAKLMLNSFWGKYTFLLIFIITNCIHLCAGKFAQSENRPRTTVVSKAEELYDLLANPSVTVNRLIPAGADMMYVNWECKGEATEQLRTVNVVIAAYTTAQARLRLHEFMHPLGNRVLYYDTDSIIYLHNPGDFEPHVGNFLGDLTDELTCYGAGSYITEFVCGGPKNYAYKVYNPDSGVHKQVCKVKGFTLNYKNAQTVNFDTIKEMILSDNVTPPVIVSDNIRCTSEHSVVTRTETKTFNINFMKRRLDDGNSYPYGYKKQRVI